MQQKRYVHFSLSDFIKKEEEKKIMQQRLEYCYFSFDAWFVMHFSQVQCTNWCGCKYTGIKIPTMTMRWRRRRWWRGDNDKKCFYVSCGCCAKATIFSLKMMMTMNYGKIWLRLPMKLFSLTMHLTSFIMHFTKNSLQLA